MHSSYYRIMRKNIHYLANKMTHKIYFRMTFFTLIFILLILGGWAFGCQAWEKGEVWKVLVALFAEGLSMVWYSLLWRRRKVPALVIDEEGLSIQISPFAKNHVRIAWQDIINIDEHVYYVRGIKHTSIYIMLTLDALMRLYYPSYRALTVNSPLAEASFIIALAEGRIAKNKKENQLQFYTNGLTLKHQALLSLLREKHQAATAHH